MRKRKTWHEVLVFMMPEHLLACPGVLGLQWIQEGLASPGKTQRKTNTMDIWFSLFGYRYDFWALGVLAQPSYNANTDFPKNFMKRCLSSSIFACMRYFKLKRRCYSVKASHIHFHFELYCFYMWGWSKWFICYHGNWIFTVSWLLSHSTSFTVALRQSLLN